MRENPRFLRTRRAAAALAIVPALAACSENGDTASNSSPTTSNRPNASVRFQPDTTVDAQPRSTTTTTEPTTTTMQPGEQFTAADLQAACSPSRRPRPILQGSCAPSRFENVPEGSNNSVAHMKTGGEVRLDLQEPEGKLVQVWDCFEYREEIIPTVVDDACEVTVRDNYRS